MKCQGTHFTIWVSLTDLTKLTLCIAWTRWGWQVQAKLWSTTDRCHGHHWTHGRSWPMDSNVLHAKGLNIPDMNLWHLWSAINRVHTVTSSFKGLRNGLAQGFPSVTIPRVLTTCQTSLASGFCHNLCHFFLILLLFLIIFVNDAIDTIVHHTPVLQCFGWSGTCSSSSKGWHNARNRVVAMVAFGFACFAGVARCGGNYIGCFGGATSYIGYIGYIGCVSFKSCFHSLWSFGLFNATSVWSTLWSTSTDRTPGCPWLWAAWWFRRTWRSLLCLIERCDWCDACHTPRTRMPWSNCHARNRLGRCCLRIAKAHLADLAYQPLVTHSWDVLHHTQIQRSRTDFRLQVLLWW